MMGFTLTWTIQLIKVLNPTLSIFTTLFFVLAGLTCILIYKEVNEREHKVPSIVPMLIFLIILGFGFIGSQINNAINYLSLKEKIM